IAKKGGFERVSRKRERLLVPILRSIFIVTGQSDGPLECAGRAQRPMRFGSPRRIAKLTSYFSKVHLSSSSFRFPKLWVKSLKRESNDRPRLVTQSYCVPTAPFVFSG